jgi:catechol 2,3-dioxygenase-like lactoylglutathione lyase family enzyme
MSMLQVTGVTHWSIPVNDLEEAEKFYTEVLGLNAVGRLGNSGLSCVSVGGHSILLTLRNEAMVRTPEQDNYLHHAFDVSPEMFERACKLFHEKGIPIVRFVYREHGVFPGRELYFLDPSGNMLELRDATWTPWMTRPTHEELARA